MNKLLNIKNLHVTFQHNTNAAFHAIKGIDLSVRKNETVGIVGESGSGKSVTSTAVMGLLPEKTLVTADELTLTGENILDLSEKELRKKRGNDISMIFQDPLTTLNPVFTIGKQIMETILIHEDVSKEEARNRTIEMLEKVGIKEAEKKLKMYPHEFSGGMRQRVMIAMSLVCQPKLLIADEPTTALDVTTQAQILDLLKEMQAEFGMSIIMITHDLGVIWETCDFVIVMFKGHIVESGTAKQIYDHPTHPYTKGLLASQITKTSPVDQKLATISYGSFIQDMQKDTALNMFEIDDKHYVAEYSDEKRRV
ncbi:MAG TPA: ABC transporter ATP-binding protein [Tetragenococcus sp.]|nr:ABC transporter ATP-binding protein [Tetragenococcus sp.]